MTAPRARLRDPAIELVLRCGGFGVALSSALGRPLCDDECRVALRVLDEIEAHEGLALLAQEPRP